MMQTTHRWTKIALCVVALTTISSFLHCHAHCTENSCACPVPRCACASTTMLDQRALWLLNCSHGRLPAIRHYLPLDRNLFYSLQSRQPYFPDFKGDWIHIDALDLTQNNIGDLKERGFSNLTALQNLNVSQNYIKDVSKQAFVGLTNLRVLNLSQNSISYIEHGAFLATTRLVVLDLNGNRLNRLAMGYFQGLVSLQYLSIQGNDLMIIDDDVFSSFLSLRSLSLSNNALHSIPSNVLKTLEQLETLDLSNNDLRQIPTKAISVLNVVQILILDRNPIDFLPSLSLHDLPLKMLSISYMPVLTIIETGAFTDLPQLYNLQIHHNDKLIHISEQAFQRLPALATLNMSHCALMTLSSGIGEALPNLKALALYDNPFICNCNILWLKTIIDEIVITNYNNSMSIIEGDIRNDGVSLPGKLDIEEIGATTCASPTDFKGVAIQNLPQNVLPEMCPPTILPSFSTYLQESVGSSLTIRCIAIGQPTPEIQWVLPTHYVLNASVPEIEGVILRSGGALVFSQISPMDSGAYLCRAINTLGSAQRGTVMKVHSNNMHLVQKAVSTSFITLTWNNSESTITTSDYVILYRPADSDTPFLKIALHPYMRAYTFAQLYPQTQYEFCIGYETPQRTVPSPIDCIKIRTSGNVHMISGIKSIKGAKVVISITVVAFTIAFLCVVSAACRTYKKRKDYGDPSTYMTCCDVRFKGKRTEQMSASIPLEDLYRTPSTSIPTTPLYASTTSLIPSTRT